GTVDGTATSVPGPCYGSIVFPESLGSGSFKNSSYHGAGAIWLEISGTATINGNITASTTVASGRPASGGSIFLTASALRGNGVISANAGGGYNGGGGGRIALVVTGTGEDFEQFYGQITAYTGTATHTGCGGAGTIYLRSAGQGPEEGCLILDNNGKNAAPTQITSLVSDTILGEVLIRNGAQLQVQTNLSLHVSRIWSNSASFQGQENAKIILNPASGVTLQVFGTTTFPELICTNNVAATILFESGKQNSISANGTLRIEGRKTEKDLLLRSTVDGVKWRLKVDPLAEQWVAHADIKDSDASVAGGVEVVAINSVDSGNNLNWNFMESASFEDNIWLGTSSAVWSLHKNWSLGHAPTLTDIVHIPASAPEFPYYDFHRTLYKLNIEEGAELHLNNFDLTVISTATIKGSLVASGNETVTVNGDLDFAGGSFTHALSSLVLGGNTDQLVDLGNLTFPEINVKKNAGNISFTDGFQARAFRCNLPGEEITISFQPNSYYKIRDMILDGGALQKITLNSSSAGNQWNLNVSGYRQVNGVKVKDSNAGGGLPISAFNSTDHGNNDSWLFGTVYKQWVPVSGNNFHTAENWNPVGVPGVNDRVLVESGTKIVVDQDVTVKELILGGRNTEVLCQINAGLSVIEGVTVMTNSVLEWNRPGSIGKDLVVMNGGVLTHAANTTTEINKLNLTVNGDFWVDQHGLVDTENKGYSINNGPGIYFGTYGGGSPSYGGVGSSDRSPSTDISKFGLCYGSIVAPTNLGSGGRSNAAGPGAGAIRFKIVGKAQIEGDVLSSTAATCSRPGSGGSIFIEADSIRGNARIMANGGDGYNGPGGGRVSLILTGDDDVFMFTGSVTAFGGDASSTGRGGAGTVYIELPSDKPGQGTVKVANDNKTGFFTDLPSNVHGVPDETEKLVFRVSDAATIRLKDNVTIGDIWLDTANATLDLNGFDLTVNQYEHGLGEGSVINPGQIIWQSVGRGTIFSFY
ncbi:MAG: hypothetical protein GX811_02090, partial [Lentisphaerae bacterium]|nr:hypothetical protein [Lentisphaerota bacterium]